MNNRRISLLNPLFEDFFKPEHNVLDVMKTFEDMFFKTIPDVTLPHDILKITKDDTIKYRIDLAVAGYPKDELQVSEEQSNLRGYKKVKVSSGFGSKKETKEDDTNDTENRYEYDENEIYIIKKLSKRNFTISWNVPESFEIESVKMDNGILSIVIDAKTKEVGSKTFDIE